MKMNLKHKDVTQSLSCPKAKFRFLRTPEQNCHRTRCYRAERKACCHAAKAFLSKLKLTLIQSESVLNVCFCYPWVEVHFESMDFGNSGNYGLLSGTST